MFIVQIEEYNLPEFQVIALFTSIIALITIFTTNMLQIRDFTNYLQLTDVVQQK